jgi:cysteine-rich repeat protein
VCTPRCGDGIIAGGEACDDGDTRSGNGCSAACTVETYFSCSGQPSACYATFWGSDSAIIQDACVEAYIHVSVPLPAGCSIREIAVQANFEHAYMSDLAVRVLPPSGAISAYLLYHQDGGTQLGVGAVSSGSDCACGPGGSPLPYQFRDGSQQPYAAFPNLPAGTYGPYSNLNATLSGQVATGTWTIGAQDTVRFDCGAMNTMSITLRCQ